MFARWLNFSDGHTPTYGPRNTCVIMHFISDDCDAKSVYFMRDAFV